MIPPHPAPNSSFRQWCWKVEAVTGMPGRHTVSHLAPLPLPPLKLSAVLIGMNSRPLIHLFFALDAIACSSFVRKGYTCMYQGNTKTLGRDRVTTLPYQFCCFIALLPPSSLPGPSVLPFLAHPHLEKKEKKEKEKTLATRDTRWLIKIIATELTIFSFCGGRVRMRVVLFDAAGEREGRGGWRDYVCRMYVCIIWAELR